MVVFALSGILLAAQDYQDYNENEIGFVFSATKFRTTTEVGMGGRFVRNYTRNLGFEFHGGFYPSNDLVNFYQAIFNFRGTYRMEERHKVNFLGVFGPGFLIVDPKTGGGRSAHVAFNAGGGLEVVPYPNVAIRADVTDFVFFSEGDVSNNADFKLAVMYRW